MISHLMCQHLCGMGTYPMSPSKHPIQCCMHCCHVASEWSHPVAHYSIQGPKNLRLTKIYLVQILALHFCIEYSHSQWYEHHELMHDLLDNPVRGILYLFEFVLNYYNCLIKKIEKKIMREYSRFCPSLFKIDHVNLKDGIFIYSSKFKCNINSGINCTICFQLFYH